MRMHIILLLQYPDRSMRPRGILQYNVWFVKCSTAHNFNDTLTATPAVRFFHPLDSAELS